MMAVMRPRRIRLVPLLIVIGGVLLAGVMGVALGLTGGSGSGSHAFDPSDDGNFNTYSLVNDLRTPVVVYLCTDSPCTQINTHSSWIPLEPGASVRESEYWNNGVSYGFKVAVSPHGRRCLLIDASTKVAGTVAVPLSKAGTCTPSTRQTS
jgi:hypothetical protein